MSGYNDRLDWLLHLIDVRDQVVLWVFVVAVLMGLSALALSRAPMAEPIKRRILHLQAGALLAAWLITWIVLALFGGGAQV